MTSSPLARRFHPSRCGFTRIDRPSLPQNALLQDAGERRRALPEGSNLSMPRWAVSLPQALGVGLLVLAGTAAHAKTVYYVANDGNDANNGTSTATPWKTVGKANTILPKLGASDQVLFKRGDVFRDDYVQCVNTKTIKAGMTVTTAPPICSGTAAAPILIGSYGTSTVPPVIDGADPLTLTWTLVSGNTWEAKITGVLPSKLFVDAAAKESKQLLPVANATGGFVTSATYKPYDLVTYNGELYVRGAQPASAGVPITSYGTWLTLADSFTGFTSQMFSATNSGAQNVLSTPGSWYASGNTILVHLADGSNPNTHSFEGTHRNYGVLLSGVNYVTVSGLTVEHTLQSGIVSIASPSFGTYFTGEYNRIIKNFLWNTGSIVADSMLSGGHVNSEAAAILVRASTDYNPHLVRGNYIGNNYVGTMDTYFGVLQATHQAGITAIGIDGSGVKNDIVIQSNYVSTVNTRGIVYNNGGLYANPGTSVRNNGGRVTANELVNNQGNLFFASVAGGMEDHNKIHHSYGEGVQTGGDSISTSTEPQVHAYDLIYHLGESASLEMFNGFDCNGGLSGGYWLNNTVYDVYGATLSLETGCTNPHVHNNIFSQNSLNYPFNNVVNNGYLVYFIKGSGDVNPDFSNNVWVSGTNFHPFFSMKGAMYCTNFFTAWPDAESSCVKDPGFKNPAAGDFSLTSSSVALKAAENATKAGAIQ